ncbi:unnamed protein product [Amoebophrya sp. A25]|nr:unnamed protein product [Amoebophrya sp. A25]|eukprot:GSA25T00019384001.1
MHLPRDQGPRIHCTKDLSDNNKEDHDAAGKEKIAFICSPSAVGKRLVRANAGRLGPLSPGLKRFENNRNTNARGLKLKNKGKASIVRTSGEVIRL